MPKRNPFKYVIEDVSRHGTVRVYYRPPGAKKKIRLWFSKEHPKFPEYYYAAKAGKPLPPPNTPSAPAKQPEEGTLAALVQAYAKSAKFKAVNHLGRRTRLAILESCCREVLPSGKPMGSIPVRFITPKHIQFLQDQKGELRGAANNRVKYLRILFSWAYKGTAQPNPAKAIDMLPPVRKGGHHAWSLAEVAKYERRHPVGTRARLALDLALYTAARRSDLVALGPANVDEDAWLSFVQSKTGGSVELPVIEPLARSIAMTRTGTDTFLVTTFGKPFTANGFGNAFRDWCDEAELPGCAVHGLRKAAASRLAELGCSGEQIKAITGHVTDKEVQRYTASARRRILAESATKILQEALREKSHPSEPSKNGGTLQDGELL